MTEVGGARSVGHIGRFDGNRRATGSAGHGWGGSGGAPAVLDGAPGFEPPPLARVYASMSHEPTV